MPLKIAAYILTKAGNRAQNKARVLLVSLLPAFGFGAAIARGKGCGEILFDIRTERSLDYVRGDRRDGLGMVA